MQRVIHAYKNVSKIFNQIEGLYTYISDYEFMYDDILWLDNSFKDVCDILQSKLLRFRTPVLKDFTLPNVLYDVSKSDTKEITVCLSGGKDSVACAYFYLKQGYTVHLYHAHGVNRAYGDEQKAAKEIADYLGCDLFIDHIETMGVKSNYIEHPLKNYIIANGAIHYALANNYPPIIAFGNFNQSTLDMNEFEVCGGDCIEMWDAYKKIVRTVIPDFDVEIPLRTNADTFELLKFDWKLFSKSVSCMSPYRFREYWRHRTEQRFNVKLFNNRCGCCWKCGLEIMWLMDNGYVEYNEEFYLHCLGIMVKTIYKETGEKPEDINLVWENYMFYPIEKSKAYDVLQNCQISDVRIDYAAKINRV